MWRGGVGSALHIGLPVALYEGSGCPSALAGVLGISRPVGAGVDSPVPGRSSNNLILGYTEMPAPVALHPAIGAWLRWLQKSNFRVRSLGPGRVKKRRFEQPLLALRLCAADSLEPSPTVLNLSERHP